MLTSNADKMPSGIHLHRALFFQVYTGSTRTSYTDARTPNITNPSAELFEDNFDV